MTFQIGGVWAHNGRVGQIESITQRAGIALSYWFEKEFVEPKALMTVEKSICYTFGYGSDYSNDRLVAHLRRVGGLLVDTRYKTWSQRPIWRGSELKNQFGDGYRQLGGWFGNINYKTPKEGILIADMESGLRYLLNFAVNHHIPFTLLCGCANRVGCHREVIANKIHEVFDIEVVHVDKPVPPSTQLSFL